MLLRNYLEENYMNGWINNMRIKKISLHMIEVPFKQPFRTSHGLYERRRSIIVEMEEESGTVGYGEVVAFTEPWYTEETIDSALLLMKDILAPVLINIEITHPDEVMQLLSKYKRNNMAKAGLEGAVWDIYASMNNRSLATALGGVREYVPAGVVVGINDIENTLQQIEKYVEQGFERVKIKVSPKNDEEVIRTIREQFPTISLLIDANSSYTLQDMDKLQNLDKYNLLMIEQPFGDKDFIQHAELQKSIQTPICLDESIDSLEDVQLAHYLGSCKIINVKSGRVGGLSESKRIHDYCQEQGISIWCGGMFETGIGRAQSIALASLPHFTIPGDISASDKYWEEDIIIQKIVVENGKVRVPNNTGLGIEINWKRLQEVLISTTTIC